MSLNIKKDLILKKPWKVGNNNELFINTYAIHNTRTNTEYK